MGLRAQTTTFSWAPSSDTTVTNYALEWGVVSHAYTFAQNAGTNTSLTLSNFVNGTTYYVAVAAANALGLQGPPSQEIAYTPSGSSNETVTVGFGGLAQTYTGGACPVTTTITPGGLAVTLTYNGSLSAPTNAGTYVVVGTVASPGYSGVSTNTLVISPAQAEVSLGGLSVTADGTAHAATVTTTPGEGLSISADDTLLGNPSYGLIKTLTTVCVVDGELVTNSTDESSVLELFGSSVSVISATWASSVASWDVTGIAQESVLPLPTIVTYNGSTTPPSAPGTYTVVATVNSPNFVGQAAATMTISPSASGIITLGNLNQVYTGGPCPVTATSLLGLLVTVTYNGSAAAPTNAGSYQVVGSILGLLGSVTNTLVIAPAPVTVSLSGLSATEDGTPHAATVMTSPGIGLAISADNTTLGNPSYGLIKTLTTLCMINGVLVTNNTPEYDALNLLGASVRVIGAIWASSQAIADVTSIAQASVIPLPTVVTYNGSTTTPTAPGIYTVTAAVNASNFVGQATATMTISSNAARIITLGNLGQTYTGGACPVTATTTPAGLPVAVTYNGSSTAPTNAGSYQVVGSIVGIAGSVTNTLVISPAQATISLSGLSTNYDGNSHAATVTTSPGVGLTIAADNTILGNPSYGYVKTLTTVCVLNGAFVTNSTPESQALSIYGASVSVVDAVWASSQGSTNVTTVAKQSVIPLQTITTYNGSATPPTAAGTYAVITRVDNSNFVGQATGTLVVATNFAKIIRLGNLSQNYTGGACSVTATTTPAGIPLTLTYNGSPNAPTNAGSYTVVGTISSGGLNGSVTNTLVISPAKTTVTLGGLNVTDDGNPHAVAVITSPGIGFFISGDVNLLGNPSYGYVKTLTTICVVNGQRITNTTPQYYGLTLSGSCLSVVNAIWGSAYGSTNVTAIAQKCVIPVPTITTYNGSTTPPAAPGTYAVVTTVANPNFVGQATGTLIIATNLARIIAFGNLAQTYTGGACPVAVTTTPPGMAVSLAYNGSPNAPTNAGSYAVVGTIGSGGYNGSVTNTLVISPAKTTVTLGGLTATNNGQSHAATVITYPGVGLSISGDVNLLGNPSYGYVKTLTTICVVNGQRITNTTPQYYGLTLSGACVTVVDAVWGSAYGSTNVTAIAQKCVLPLPTITTYNGSTTPPTATGTYTVVSSVSDPNFTGSATSTLVIVPEPIISHAEAAATIVLTWPARGGGNISVSTNLTDWEALPLSIEGTNQMILAKQPGTWFYRGPGLKITTAP